MISRVFILNMDLCQTSPGTNYKRNFTPPKELVKTAVKSREKAPARKEAEKISLKIDYCDRYARSGARPTILRKKGCAEQFGMTVN